MLTNIYKKNEIKKNIQYCERMLSIFSSTKVNSSNKSFKLLICELKNQKTIAINDLGFC